MKMKSVSDNNLENIIKQMLNVALKDPDQIAKLHQAIYEEWYFKKMMTLEETRTRIENTNKNAHNEKPYKISEDQEVISNSIISNNIAPSPEITEIWHYSMQREKTKKKLESNIIEQQNEGKLTKQVKRKLSFESWKKGKNLIYRRLLKEAEEKKQQELQKKLKDIECKKASQEVYAQIIKEKEAQQRRELKQLQMIQQMNMEILQQQNNERRIINNQAFNVWKRRKDIKLKETKLITM
ncbi:uncharacterized protein [Anoplolepis gracilipes]|uniref:uncharacterized protein n=1 Tax=Anoplolepis gracilipes TaxID=354296 RepID=UPI003B9E2F2E